jgi:CBS domain-containing protein
MTLQVKDVMITNIITIDADAAAKEAAELLDKHDIGCVIVTSYGNPIGIVTESDMLKRVLLKEIDLTKTKVGSIMSAPLTTSHPQAELSDAIRLMTERGIKKLPVMEDGKLIGLVSLPDITRSLAYFAHIISSLCTKCQLGKPQQESAPEQQDSEAVLH